MASKISLIRTSQYINGMRSFKVYVDGLKMESIRDGETKEYELSPGNHRIQLEIDWIETDLIEFYLPENAQKTFMCGSHITGWKMLLTIVFLFVPRMWIFIRES